MIPPQQLVLGQVLPAWALLCVGKLEKCCGRGCVGQGETCVREVDICQTAGCEVQGVAACHLVNKQQLLKEDGGEEGDSYESAGTWQMDVLFHMCK